MFIPLQPKASNHDDDDVDDNTKLLTMEMYSSIPHQRFLVQPRLENLLESHHLWEPKWY